LGWGATELSKIDSAVYKIALAGFLHDIGKFIQRANFLTKEQINDLYNHHANRILPYRHTHQHALYTAWFIQWFEKHLKQILEKLKTGEDFLNLSAKHHKPETPLQWIVAMADRVASGFDRETFEEYNQEEKVQDYRKVHLYTIFEQIFSDKNKFNYRYPMKQISPESIFPEKLEEGDEAEYRELFKKFLEDVKNLKHRQNITLWFEHFESLFEIYASHIPAATVGKFIPDVSLFDHCKITSALASALYLYHSQTDTMDIEKIKDEETEKILIINGDFYGIQKFIFSEGNRTNKNSAKILRGRSFAVSLYSELAAYYLAEEIGLPSVCVILNNAGKFTLLAPNIEETERKMKEVKRRINKWLIENFYGEVSMGFASVEASLSDFHIEEFKKLWEKISRKIEEKKFQKIDLNEYAGVIGGYVKSFKDKDVCSFCGRRPAEQIDFEEFKEPVCKICRDHIFLGRNLVRREKIAIMDREAVPCDTDNKLMLPVFDKYQITFPTGYLDDLAQENRLLKFWDISIGENGEISKNTTAKFINGYVPRWRGDEDEEKLLNRIMAGEKSEETKTQLIEDIKAKTIKNFLFISKYALNETPDPEKFKGVEYLGVLKADVDNFGKIFKNVKNATLSRYATLSRQINNFFSIWLPYVLKTDERFENIYTIFAGGDDLFLIGPWNRIIEVASYIRENFKRYVCGNEKITLSTGISINHPSESILFLADKTEKKLEKAKEMKGKDSISIFNVTVKWQCFSKLMKIRDEIENLFKKKVLNRAMLYRLLEVSRMAENSVRIKEKIKEGAISVDELKCLKWPAFLKYTFARNIKEETAKITEDVFLWIEEHKGGMIIPLYWIIYNSRGG